MLQVAATTTSACVDISSTGAEKLVLTRRMIDNVNEVQAFLPAGSSLVESRRQKGR